MDLIYMNNAKEDIGVLQSYELDMAFGSDENTFECNIQAKDHCCEAGHYLYIEGTEYGGIIDTIQSKTGEDEVIYSGRTWHGIIGSKIILPLLGGEEISSDVTVRTQDSKGNSLVGRYLIVSGDANYCISYILSRCGLSDLFEAPSTASGITINAYQFHRFTDAYTGLNKMLASAGAKLKLAFQGGKIIVEAVKRYDYSEDDSFDSDLVDFRITKRYRTVNHLICLGSGELENRMVVHLYADAEGNISQTQTQFGLDEYCATYDYSAIESEEELIQSGTDELKALWEQDSLSLDFDESMDAYDVGDIVGAIDNVTGVAVSSAITKKIVTIRNGKITIDLSTDAVTASGSGATGDGESTYHSELSKRDRVRNLLDNSDFTNPVNQRGQTSYTGNGKYTVDRWYIGSSNNEVTVSDSCVTVTTTVGTAYASLVQKVADASKLAGRTLTLAARVYSSAIPRILIGHNSTTLCVVRGTALTDSVLVATFTVPEGIQDAELLVWITGQSAATFDYIQIYWAALYEGSYTAETLPEYVPKGYGAELAECMRYYYRITSYWKFLVTGICTANTLATISLKLPVPMRIAPTANIPDTSLIKVRCGNVASQVPSAIAWADASKLHDYIQMTATVSGVTNGETATIYFDNGGVIEFSADL